MSKKLPIYFSDDAWSSLQELMGPEGKPSPTINTVLEQIAVQNELVEKLGLTAVLPKSKVSIPVSLERIPAGPDRKSTRLNSSHMSESRMPSSA